MTIEVEEFIDGALIERVTRRENELAARARLTANDHSAATAARTAAEEIARVAPSLENESALEAADRAARVAAKLHAAAAEEHKKYVAWLPLAKGAAHGRLYMKGCRARIAAAKKSDDAKKLAEEAEDDFKAAVQTIHQAHSAGHQHLRAIINGSHLLTSEERELSIWRANNADPFSETNEWVQHVLAQEPEGI